MIQCPNYFWLGLQHFHRTRAVNVINNQQWQCTHLEVPYNAIKLWIFVQEETLLLVELTVVSKLHHSF